MDVCGPPSLEDVLPSSPDKVDLALKYAQAIVKENDSVIDSTYVSGNRYVLCH